MARTEKATDPQAHPLQYWFLAHPPGCVVCQRLTRGPGSIPEASSPSRNRSPKREGIRTLFPVHLGGRDSLFRTTSAMFRTETISSPGSGQASNSGPPLSDPPPLVRRFQSGSSSRTEHPVLRRSLGNPAGFSPRVGCLGGPLFFQIKERGFWGHHGHTVIEGARAGFAE